MPKISFVLALSISFIPTRFADAFDLKNAIKSAYLLDCSDITFSRFDSKWWQGNLKREAHIFDTRFREGKCTSKKGCITLTSFPCSFLSNDCETKEYVEIGKEVETAAIGSGLLAHYSMSGGGGAIDEMSDVTCKKLPITLPPESPALRCSPEGIEKWPFEKSARAKTEPKVTMAPNGSIQKVDSFVFTFTEPVQFPPYASNTGNSESESPVKVKCSKGTLTIRSQWASCNKLELIADSPSAHADCQFELAPSLRSVFGRNYPAAKGLSFKTVPAPILVAVLKTKNPDTIHLYLESRLKNPEKQIKYVRLFNRWSKKEMAFTFEGETKKAARKFPNSESESHDKVSRKFFRQLETAPMVLVLKTASELTDPPSDWWIEWPSGMSGEDDTRTSNTENEAILSVD